MNNTPKFTEDDIPEGALALIPRDVYDKAVLGTLDTKLVYDQDLVVEAGIEIYGTHEDSLEWHDYNTFGAYLGEGTPLFITQFSNEHDIRYECMKKTREEFDKVWDSVTDTLSQPAIDKLERLHEKELNTLRGK